VHEIITPRLELRLMPEEFFEAGLKNRTAAAEALIGLRLPPAWFEEKELMAMRLADCRTDAAYARWSLRAIGLRSTGVMVGHIGFHSCPDADYLRRFVPDGIEFGYTVFPEYRRQGYAREAIRGLINWAAKERHIRHFVVSISPTNVASSTLAGKLGFVKAGEHLDEVDGLEEVYVLAGEARARLLADA
jgi:RimJ/RimL family protein N-acetyltransferase